VSTTQEWKNKKAQAKKHIIRNETEMALMFLRFKEKMSSFTL